MIIASAVVATVMDNATIVAAAESTAEAEAEALPFSLFTTGTPASAVCN